MADRDIFEMKSFEEFVALLKLLDSIITEKYGKNKIELDMRMIGGFAMMYHSHIEKVNVYREYSVDADYLEKENDIIEECLKEIENRIGEDPHWLNNAWYKNNNYYDELFPYSVFLIDESLNLDNINLYIADLETIMAFKARAINNKIEYNLRIREQDIEDVRQILNLWNISEEDFIRKMDSINIEQRYPHFMEWIRDNYFYS